MILNDDELRMRQEIDYSIGRYREGAIGLAGLTYRLERVVDFAEAAEIGAAVGLRDIWWEIEMINAVVLDERGPGGLLEPDAQKVEQLLDRMGGLCKGAGSGN